jgi:hypothetical protein
MPNSFASFVPTRKRGKSTKKGYPAATVFASCKTSQAAHLQIADWGNMVSPEQDDIEATLCRGCRGL